MKTEILGRQVEMLVKKVRRVVQEIESRLIIKPKTNLEVWNFIASKVIVMGTHATNTNKLICCKCLEPVTASYRNTSNLFDYLHRKHSLVYAYDHDEKKSKRNKKR